MATSDGFPVVLVVSFCFFYFVVFLLSTLGNSLVLISCYRSLRRRTSSLKWLIANLAIADLAFTVLSTLDLIAFLWNWVGGQASCKLQSFLIETCYTTSIMTLVLISFERLKAVLDPFSTRTSNPNGAFKKVVVIWMLSFIVCSPLLYAYQAQPDNNGSVHCTNISFGDTGRQIYYGIHAVCFFLVPLMYMIYAQGTIFRSLGSTVFPLQDATSTASPGKHRKVAKTLAALTVAFAVCWSPFVIVRALMYFHVVAGGYIWRAVQLLIFVNSALDPVLYGLYGENLKAILKRRIRCSQAQTSTRLESFTTGRTVRSQ